MSSTPSLTEDQIKRIALAYLKHYYRFRPRTENEASLTLLDSYLEGDIQVDVMLIFCRPEILHTLSSQKNEQQKALQIISNDQCDFIATCEATSREVKKELYYHFEKNLWRLDSLAFGLFLTTGFFIYAELLPDWFPPLLQPLLQPFEKHQPVLLAKLAIGLSFFTAAIGALISRYNKRFNIRYRYIYALRQFEKYYADEQWVAFSQEVFEENEGKTYWKKNKHYRELYRQALGAGVGLLAIDEKKNVIPIITPRRKKLRIKESRKKRAWQKIVRAASIQKAKQKTEKLRSQLDARISSHKFRHSYTAPILLSALFMLIIGLSIWRHYPLRPGARESSHAAELKNWQEQKTKPITLSELQRQRLALQAFIDTPFWPVNLPFLFDSTTYIDPILLEMQRRKRENRIFVPMRPPEDTSSTRETDTLKPPDSGY